MDYVCSTEVGLIKITKIYKYAAAIKNVNETQKGVCGNDSERDKIVQINMLVAGTGLENRKKIER